MKEARYYIQKGDRVTCTLCPHHCNLKESEIGKCQVKQNLQGKLMALNYGKVAAIQIDLMEKKPLYHFMPGTRTLSIGSIGCNFTCSFCQNHHIAHAKDFAGTTEDYTPHDIVQLAKLYQTPSISFTYNEPSTFYEFVYDTATLAHQEDIKNILVTNGYLEEEPLIQLLPYIDAMNVDLKTFRNENYQTICGGLLEPVKRTIMLAAQMCHVEITTLIVTNMNDQEEELRELVDWIAEVNPNIPLHLSRYFPQYQYHEQATDVDFMYRMQDMAKQQLKYVHLGNVY
ncbi:AmmeMemoRadiSam system radical SAM enzyme [Desulfuribacillus stibiiarsenatis]|uniref:AmmeMemoRadiSam system radical SAM enzyme n=1 Tax=Desulfuribacillus stibiiarsenatis TaxID=1390249 RepID=A0A1E5L425_9FIRM|nr:AmmeMemoRadiSam system radical SAM enzyme [Desulfuribacillus stibiiarsenatis]OEH84908.1 AmmeMemoRadiSam system radical SAM enzyme [Desulfuribacillus stibiiarsenatis]